MFFINRLTFNEREEPMSMRIRKLLPAFIMSAALTLTIPVSVYAAEDDNQTGLIHCVYISDTIDNYVVGRIEAKAFYEDTTMKKLSLPGGLTSIGDSAFYNCQQLKEIEFPDKSKAIAMYYTMADRQSGNCLQP